MVYGEIREGREWKQMENWIPDLLWLTPSLPLLPHVCLPLRLSPGTCQTPMGHLRYLAYINFILDGFSPQTTSQCFQMFGVPAGETSRRVVHACRLMNRTSPWGCLPWAGHNIDGPQRWLRKRRTSQSPFKLPDNMKCWRHDFNAGDVLKLEPMGCRCFYDVDKIYRIDFVESDCV